MGWYLFHFLPFFRGIAFNKECIMAHKRFLKQVFIFFSAVIFCNMVFIACGGGDDNPNTTNPGTNVVTLSGTYDYVTLAALGQKNIFNSNGTFKIQYNMNTVTETPTYNYTVKDNLNPY